MRDFSCRQDESRRFRRGRTDSVSLSGILLGFVVGAFTVTGCHSWPWRPGPVPESVAVCRSFSQEARIAMDRGAWSEAETLLERAIQACATDADAHRELAEVLLKRDAGSEAVVHLEKARRLVPHDTPLTIRAGEVYLALGRLPEAEHRAGVAIQLDQTSADAWALRGRVKVAKGQHHEALADMQRALGYRPDDRALLRSVARLHSTMNRPDRALLCLQNCADTYVAGEEPIALLEQQAQVYASLDRKREALACHRAICHREQPTAEQFYQLAESEWRAGSPANATAAVQAALRLQPDHPASREFLARFVVPGRSGRALR